MSSELSLVSIEQMLLDQPTQPPVHLWKPKLSGEIDILIRADGRWLHEGGLIERDKLVALFASILRREDDGEYYLLTPVEKWRITVEDAALLAVDMDVIVEEGGQQLVFTTNVGTRFLLDKDHPLRVVTDECGHPSPELILNNGLHAKLSRSVYYRLVELAEQKGECFIVRSAGQEFTVS